MQRRINKDIDNDNVTLSREEYNKLKKSANNGNKLWYLFITVLIVLVLGSFYAIVGENSVETTGYYERDIKLIEKEDISKGNGKLRNNYRPGRKYHRGGNYGKVY